jgi:uncharacterized protein YycO
MSNKVFEPGELHSGDFILFAGEGFVSRGIKLFSGSKWTHAAQFVGNGYVIEATRPGVEKNLLAPLIKKAAHICVLRVPNLSVDDSEILKAGAYSQLTVGTEYDFANLVTLAPYFVLRRLGLKPEWISWLVWSNKGEVICSELCARDLLAICIKLARSPKLVSPGTMYDAVKKGIFEKPYED